MPSAPAAMHCSAARTTLGIPMLREFRSSATLLRLTLSRVIDIRVTLSGTPHPSLKLSPRLQLDHVTFRIGHVNERYNSRAGHRDTNKLAKLSSAGSEN